MKRLIVRYKVKADRAEENQKYIQKVFEEQKNGQRLAANADHPEVGQATQDKRIFHFSM